MERDGECNGQIPMDRVLHHMDTHQMHHHHYRKEPDIYDTNANLEKISDSVNGKSNKRQNLVWKIDKKRWVDEYLVVQEHYRRCVATSNHQNQRDHEDLHQGRHHFLVHHRRDVDIVCTNAIRFEKNLQNLRSVGKKERLEESLSIQRGTEIKNEKEIERI